MRSKTRNENRSMNTAKEEKIEGLRGKKTKMTVEGWRKIGVGSKHLKKKTGPKDFVANKDWK